MFLNRNDYCHVTVREREREVVAIFLISFLSCKWILWFTFYWQIFCFLHFSPATKKCVCLVCQPFGNICSCNFWRRHALYELILWMIDNSPLQDYIGRLWLWRYSCTVFPHNSSGSVSWSNNSETKNEKWINFNQLEKITNGINIHNVKML